MPDLRGAMRSFLAGWQGDVSAKWRAVLDGVEPAFDAVRADLALHDGDTIFPSRRGHLLAGAPPRSHVFRALDGIAPRAVRVVVVGQDPYPQIGHATGRAFEQGDLAAWPEKPGAVADSLARIIQAVAAARSGRPIYTASDKAWARLYADRDAPLALLPPRPQFDAWQKQGVLFLNTALTLSRFEPGGGPEQLYGHIPLWRPVIYRIFDHLATRPKGQVVFALWGTLAKKAFRASGVKAAALAAGTWGVRVDAVEHAHPNARSMGAGPPFFRDPNPFVAINQRLTALGAAPIAW